MQRGFTLSEDDQTKITLIFTNFSKSEPGMLKYSEVVMLLLDRQVFSNQFTLIQFQGLFEAALKVKTGRPSDKTEVQGERFISREQLMFLLNEAAKLIYMPNPNYLQKFYAYLLSQPPRTQAVRQNSLQVDDTWKRFVMEEAVIELIKYEQQIRHIFMGYINENYWYVKRKRRLMLTQPEVMLQNKKWSYISIVLFLKESETSPHLASVEHCEEIMRGLVPPGLKQMEFYNRHVLSDAYHKDVNGSEGGPHVASDPGLMLFEFHLFLMRLAWDTFPRDLERKQIGPVLLRYFKYLYLRSDQQIEQTKLPDISRKMMSTMKDYYRVINHEVSQADNTHDPDSHISLYQQLSNKMDKEVMQADSLQLDFNEISKVLSRELPKLPPLPAVEKEYHGNYDKKFAVTIGQQPPPEPEEKGEKAGKPEKKENKKDEVPARVFKWQDFPTEKKSTEDYLKGIQQKLDFEVKPLGDIQRGIIQKQGYPVLIGESLFPPELPKDVVPYVQAFNTACAQRNYLLALQNLKLGTNAWRKSSVQLDAVGELYFEFSRGNVYLAADKLEHAFSCFYSCRKFADTSKLPFSNPDRSLPYFGMGEVFFEMMEYDLAARSFLKAREIRESVLGLEHVQTASVFNNLAACYFLLRRSQEALGYIEIAEVVLDTELGPHHERTMTSRNNFKKISRGTFDNQPAFRKFWEVFEEDKFAGKKKKKKGGDDKKKKK